MVSLGSSTGGQHWWSALVVNLGGSPGGQP